MTYKVKCKGLVVCEFDTVGELDRYLADRVWDWLEMEGVTAHLGVDYLDLINSRGTKITLTFDPISRPSSLADTFTEGKRLKQFAN